MIIKPVSIIAFFLTLLAATLLLIAVWLPRWFVLQVPGSDTQAWYGLWHQQRCSPEGCGPTSSFTRIEGGKEFFFVAKVFKTIGAIMVLGSLILHVLYVFWRQPLVRQISIYTLCGAGLFGLLASLIFVARYGQMTEYKGQEVAFGPCFSLSLIGSLVCLLASAFTAWASYNKANYDDDEEDTKQFAGDIKHPDFDALD